MVVLGAFPGLQSSSCGSVQFREGGNYSAADLNHMVRFRTNPEIGAKIEFGP